MATTKVTINDVAKAAGVSKGTVDRVLHNRGEVSQKSRDKVLKIIDELGYQPNVYASILASQKQLDIVCVIPEHSDGDFWSLTAKGIETASNKAGRYGITVDILTYDQYDEESFRTVCAEVLDRDPSGVVVAPMFRDETLTFVKSLSTKGIPYVYIDSKLEDDGYFAYFGMPMRQSGILCADILTNGNEVHKVYVIRIERDKKGLSDPTLVRREGFIEYMSENYPSAVIENVFINPKDADDIKSKLDDILSCNLSSEEKYIVMFNSRVHLVADYIRNTCMNRYRVVGFDALDRNITALKDGFVHALIAQHSDIQAANAVNALVDYLVLGIVLSPKDNYTQMDILNKYNCDYYM